jgi:hypothetical protein
VVHGIRNVEGRSASPESLSGEGSAALEKLRGEGVRGTRKAERGWVRGTGNVKRWGGPRYQKC